MAKKKTKRVENKRNTASAETRRLKRLDTRKKDLFKQLVLYKNRILENLSPEYVKNSYRDVGLTLNSLAVLFLDADEIESIRKILSTLPDQNKVQNLKNEANKIRIKKGHTHLKDDASNWVIARTAPG